MTSGPFVDIHCHILPGIDDGPADVSAAVDLVTGLARLGFGELHPTPHQRAGFWTPTPDEREQAASDLRLALEQADHPAGCQHGASPTVDIRTPGGENMWDDVFLERQTDGSYPSYEGGGAFLLELLTGSPPPQLERRLCDFRIKHGRLAVLAHVERYSWIAGNPDRLAGRAALLVNVGTLGGQAGWWLQRRARALVKQGAIHAVTTDAHMVDDIPHIRAGIAWISREMGAAALEELLIEGPRRILAGEIP